MESCRLRIDTSRSCWIHTGAGYIQVLDGHTPDWMDTSQNRWTHPGLAFNTCTSRMSISVYRIRISTHSTFFETRFDGRLQVSNSYFDTPSVFRCTHLLRIFSVCRSVSQINGKIILFIYRKRLKYNIISNYCFPNKN